MKKWKGLSAQLKTDRLNGIFCEVLENLWYQ